MASAPGSASRALLERLIERIDHAAALPDDPPPRRLRKTLLLFLNAFGMLIVPWGALYFARAGMSLAGAVAAGYTVVSTAALIHLLATKRESVSIWTQLTSLLLVPFLIHWIEGGFASSGGVVLWSMLSPMVALVFHGAHTAVAWFVAFLLLVLLAGAKDIATGADLGAVILFSENVLIVSCLGFIAMRYFMIERDKARAALQREQERSERLLLNILPAPIAERLKTGHQTIADGFAEVTILFADIVGFTQLSAKISPERLVEVLNSLFSRFDRLVDRYGVEKIKTIGDAYMVCAGLPMPKADHAEAIADIALGMRRAVEEHNREFGTSLKIRIGIHSGPVVAGVIGLKKFIYDLWGDTVNLASRMESHGLPDCIQVTAATWERLRNQYVFEQRGMVEVKGIGQVATYLLKARKEPTPG